MSTETQEQKPQPQTPFDYLAFFPGAPDRNTIESLKKQVPGGRLRLLPMPDGKRLFLLRGFTSLELVAFQAEAAKVAPEKQLSVLQAQTAIRCTIWASIAQPHANGKLTEHDLASSGAGLAATLHTAIMDLSDYTDPVVLEQMYVDF